MVARMLIAVMFFTWNPVSISPLQAQGEPFYEGKTVRLIAGFSPGGIVDLWARLLARHMGKYIPGTPSFIVQNMPGAAGTVAANYVYNMGEPDVTILHFGGTQILNHVLGDPAAKFDGRKFGYLGAPTANSVICFVREGTLEEFPADAEGVPEVSGEVDIVVHMTEQNAESCGPSRDSLQSVTRDTLRAAGMTATTSERASSWFYSVLVHVINARIESRCVTSLTIELAAAVQGIPEADWSAEPGAWGSLLAGQMPLVSARKLVTTPVREHDSAVREAVRDQVSQIAARLRAANPK